MSATRATGKSLSKCSRDSLARMVIMLAFQCFVLAARRRLAMAFRLAVCALLLLLAPLLPATATAAAVTRSQRGFACRGVFAWRRARGGWQLCFCGRLPFNRWQPCNGHSVTLTAWAPVHEHRRPSAPAHGLPADSETESELASPCASCAGCDTYLCLNGWRTIGRLPTYSIQCLPSGCNDRTWWGNAHTSAPQSFLCLSCTTAVRERARWTLTRPWAHSCDPPSCASTAKSFLAQCGAKGLRKDASWVQCPGQTSLGCTPRICCAHQF
jgi:hypothetical protein